MATEEIPTSLENARTDYSDETAIVTFRCSADLSLVLAFPKEGPPCLFANTSGPQPRTPASFVGLVPLRVVVVPVLGPVEHREVLVEPDTVNRGIATHRASRHFRNYWRLHPETFPEFQRLLGESWRGMVVRPPELSGTDLSLFCEENRMSRELFWTGFGFQVWCQLLTHAVRAMDASMFVVDEPDIYLHPEIQVRFISLLRALGPDIVLATHSGEIIGSCEPSEILLINKSQRSASRLGDVREVQAALDQIGSLHNITLARLAKAARILFVEGDDYKILQRLGQAMGLGQLADPDALVVVPVGGFSNWRRVEGFSWGLVQASQQRPKIAVLLDRDFHTPWEISEVVTKLSGLTEWVQVHERKEIENYLLCPDAIHRVLARRAAQRGAALAHTPATIQQALEECIHSVCNETRAQWVGARLTGSGKGIDLTTRLAQATAEFDSVWATLSGRLAVAPGKEVLARLAGRLQTETGLSVSATTISLEMTPSEIPAELGGTIRKIQAFAAS
ncbi:MAG: AAA family ATPase [Deltaproteobacteria bacterium]|nr:AAA family ATPase [Deltaproteobacteria bacterium]